MFNFSTFYIVAFPNESLLLLWEPTQTFFARLCRKIRLSHTFSFKTLVFPVWEFPPFQQMVSGLNQFVLLSKDWKTVSQSQVVWTNGFYFRKIGNQFDQHFQMGWVKNQQSTIDWWQRGSSMTTSLPWFLSRCMAWYGTLTVSTFGLILWWMDTWMLPLWSLKWNLKMAPLEKEIPFESCHFQVPC